jgi:GT2 family glycosyltransferase
MVPEPALSVIVPTRDKPDRLRITLACLAGQDLADREVVIVDDGSSAETDGVIRAADLPAVVVRLDGRGRAAARNAGAGQAGGALLLFLDDDVVVANDCLAQHLQAQECGPAVVHGPLREYPAARRFVDQCRLLTEDQVRLACAELLQGARGRTLSNALERLLRAVAEATMPEVAPWLGCVGANTSMPRSVWRAAGGFDERFGTGWGCEDLELGLRLSLAGVAFRRLAPAAGIHLSHARPDRWEQHRASLTRFAALHQIPAVAALESLLGANGSPGRYVADVLERSDLKTTRGQ